MPTKIMMVHDDRRFIEEASSALELAGYHVTTLSNPNDALTALEMHGSKF